MGTITGTVMRQQRPGHSAYAVPCDQVKHEAHADANCHTTARVMPGTAADHSNGGYMRSSFESHVSTRKS